MLSPKVNSLNLTEYMTVTFAVTVTALTGIASLRSRTTSNTHNRIDDYKIYLVQLLKYMEVNKVTKGLLAVYSRPSDLIPDLTLIALKFGTLTRRTINPLWKK